MKTMKLLNILRFTIIVWSFTGCSQNDLQKDDVLFFSSFDGSVTADIAQGDAQIYSAKSYKEAANAKAGITDANVLLAKGAGHIGDAIHFKEAKTAAIFYKAFKNVGYSSSSWSGTVSFWLRLDPNKDLAPHYCDPICITDTKWSDAGLWVDFTNDSPRKFRYGAMGDIAVWDPNEDSDENDWNKRTITVDPSPFQSETWTHVAMVFSEINTLRPTFRLYLNGIDRGGIEQIPDPFTWEEENGKIMLGLGYIGMMDELAIFNKALNAKEVRRVFELKNGIKSLWEE